MRLHIEIDDRIVTRIDKRTGPRNRSRFIRDAIIAALESEQRWDLILSAAGTISDAEHDWDADPAAWVHAQRSADRKRVG